MFIAACVSLPTDEWSAVVLIAPREPTLLCPGLILLYLGASQKLEDVHENNTG